MEENDGFRRVEFKEKGGKKVRLKRNFKKTLLSALTISCMGPSALLAEEKKEVSEKDLMRYLGPVVASAYPHFTDEEREAFRNLLKEAMKRKHHSGAVQKFNITSAEELRLSWFSSVTDDVLRQNLADFTGTCFYMPYALMNVGGRKQAALEADSVVEFVKAHPHPSLGIYWKDNAGAKTYKSCKEAVSAVESALESVSQEERGIIEESFRRLQESKKEEKCS